MSTDPLGVDPETMRQLGYRTVDLLVDWLQDESGPPPADPEPMEEILGRLARDVLPFASRVHHPAFFAFIPGSGTWPGALGDLVASAANVFAGSWMESAGPSQVELEVLRWFASWIDYPVDTNGILVDGGSAANLTALACAREIRGGGVVYAPDQAHASIARAARVLGFGPQDVRVLPVGADYRLEPKTLAGAMAADERAGRRPFFVCASGGSTNTGAVDPLAELAAVAGEYGAWLHADAAYGGFAALTERSRSALAGIARADSVTLDPHKWLYQPYECGCLLVREPGALRRAFELTPDYLADARAGDGEVNFEDRGLQLTRTSRALKVWISVRYFGLDAFRLAIDRSLDLAEYARARVRASPVLELAAPGLLGIVCLRRRFERDEDALNTGLADALERSGLGLVSTTRLQGRVAIRLCPLNHASTKADVERVLDFLETAQPEPTSRPPLARDRDLAGTWLLAEPVDRPELAGVPLFASLRADDFEHVARLARVREAAPGEQIVERWGTSREFYVVLEGSVSVSIGQARVRDLGPGEFFDELAALDWEAGFAYPRLASVVAASPLRLLVFSASALNRLVRDFSAIGEEIRAAAAERVRWH